MPVEIVKRPQKTVNEPLPAPAEKPADAPAEKPADASGTADQGAELASLRAEVQSHKDREKRRSVAIRKLAATLLMPASSNDGGAAKTASLRNVLTEFVNEFAPAEDE